MIDGFLLWPSCLVLQWHRRWPSTRSMTRRLTSTVSHDDVITHLYRLPILSYACCFIAVVDALIDGHACLYRLLVHFMGDGNIGEAVQGLHPSTVLPVSIPGREATACQEQLAQGVCGSSSILLACQPLLSTCKSSGHGPPTPHVISLLVKNSRQHSPFPPPSGHNRFAHFFWSFSHYY